MSTKTIIAIDIETSGPSINEHDLTCFAAVAISYPAGKELGAFKVYIKPVTGTIRYHPETLKFWQSQEAAWEMMKTGIVKEGKEASVAMNEFVAWMTGFKENSLVVFDTASFDVSFINRYLGYTDVPSMDYIHGEYKPVFDTTSFHRGIAWRGWGESEWGNDTAAGNVLGILGIDARCPYKNSHDPLDDARKIAWTTCVLADIASKISPVKKE